MPTESDKRITENYMRDIGAGWDDYEEDEEDEDE